MTPDISVLPDLEAISHEAARWVVVGAREAALFTGRCTIALSGGSTPRRLYELLASDEYRDVVPWDVIEWYWGDERCVPPDHEASNYRMAWDVMLGRAPVPESSVFRMPGEARDHVRAARRYENLLRDRLPDLAFDLVLLGIGSDGHTASLFPHSAALSERERLVLHTKAPKGSESPNRLSVTLPLLAHARNILVLAAGRAKRPIVEAVVSSPEAAAARYPIARVRTSGHLTWLVDEAAGA
ncbi:MAG TPA: 6-phosphogluconolactonase [Gemmatimonadales bacterium]|nr:6-phosphogluconolactonase [Gemmatimonadales bacterium]